MMPQGQRRHPLHRLRPYVQLAFFALFLVLLVLTALGTAVTASTWLADLFLITDPLILVCLALAGAATPVLMASLVAVALSLLVPRAYCGWICPLGTAMDMVDRVLFRNRDRAANIWPRARQVKYALLASLLVLAILRLGVFGWFDPISIVTRSFGVAVYPMADHAAKAGLVAAEKAGVGAAGGLYDWAERSRIFIREADFKKGATGAGYAWTWVFAAIFLAILLAQAWQKRFWCRNLCPLGALVGLLGSVSPLRPRVGRECISCGACQRGCKTGAFQAHVPHLAGAAVPLAALSKCAGPEALAGKPPVAPAGSDEAVIPSERSEPATARAVAVPGSRNLAVAGARPAVEPAAEAAGDSRTSPPAPPRGGAPRFTCLVQECIFCYACEGDLCPVGAIHIGAGRPWPVRPEPQVVPGRRALLGVAAASIFLGPAMILDRRTRAKEETDPMLRPPGALRPDDEFEATCVRCGACMRACPTNALHPSGIENGIAGLWTPAFLFNIGACDYFCNITRDDVDRGRTGRTANLCGVVCPTGAIACLRHADKAAWRIGTAVFDKGRCLPWARGEECLVCEEQCPLPDKAISHAQDEVANLEWLKMPEGWRNRYEALEARDEQGQLTAAEQAEFDAMPPKTRSVALPCVLRDRCTGCGVCENVCPVDGPGGIRVERLQTRDVKDVPHVRQQLRRRRRRGWQTGSQP